MQAPYPSSAPRSILVDMPRGTGPHPAVVLAPGVSYHLRMPLMERLGQVLPEHGIAVFRFNWRYMDSEPQGQPSDDLSVEQAELAAVIALARADVRVRPDRLVVAGKSMGSVVATRIFAADPALAGAVLLTPLISRPNTGDAAPTNTADLHHGSLSSEQRPLTRFALSDASHRRTPIDLSPPGRGDVKQRSVRFDERALRSEAC